MDDCTRREAVYPTRQDGNPIVHYEMLSLCGIASQLDGTGAHPSGIGALRPGIRNVG